MSSNAETIMEQDIIKKSVQLMIYLLSAVSENINQFESNDINQMNRMQKPNERKLKITLPIDNYIMLSEIRIINGTITNESITDTVNDIVQRVSESAWQFKKRENYDLNFGDDPPCDIRSCWYLKHREYYKYYTGSNILKYKHLEFVRCDRCKENDISYGVEQSYQTVIQTISSDILNALEKNNHIKRKYK